MMHALAELNRMVGADFAATVGDTFELAPWVAEQAAVARPFSSVTALHDAMMAVVRAAPRARQLEFLRGHPDLAGKLAQAGRLTAESTAEQASVGLDRLTDAERYQTVFSARPASAAAPTAGLHLTDRLLAELTRRGVATATVELVVGLDTFRPLSTERVEDHAIHTERYSVPAATWEAVERTRADGGRVVAVGTTSVRALESRAARGEPSGRTDLFITPGYRFAVVDAMVTNFHLPRTSLLALVQAFVGPRWRDLYATALADGYRFLSFGDAMLLERAEPLERADVGVVG